MVRLVEADWTEELADGMQADRAQLRIVCPFIKASVVERLATAGFPETVEVITRFNKDDWASGVGDASALRVLLGVGARIRGIQGLHAKVYIFGTSRVIVSSANLTEAGLGRNYEFGLVSTDPEIVDGCNRYFDSLWEIGDKDLSEDWLARMESEVDDYRKTAPKADPERTLGDEGARRADARSIPPPGLRSTDRYRMEYLGPRGAWVTYGKTRQSRDKAVGTVRRQGPQRAWAGWRVVDTELEEVVFTESATAN